MINKNILIIIHRGYSEFDWLKPIINDLSQKNKIFFLFTNIAAFKSFSADSKGEEFIQKSKNIVLKKSNNLIYKVVRKTFKNLKYFETSNILNALEKKINNIDYIKKTFFKNPKKNFDIVFSQNGITSGWAYNFYVENKSLVISFPATSRLSMKEEIIPLKARPFAHYMLLNTESEKKNWSKKFDKKRIIVVGMPKFNQINFENRRSFNKKKKIKQIVFAFTSNFKRFGKEKDKILEKQFFDVMEILNKIKNTKIFLKVHPTRNHPYYKKILKKFDKKKFLETNTNLKDLALKSDLLITNLDSSAILDGLLAKIPSIEFWRALREVNRFSFSYFSRNKLSKLCKNKKELKKYILLGLNNPNDNFWKRKYFNFKKIYQPKKINYNLLIYRLLKYEKFN